MSKKYIESINYAFNKHFSESEIVANLQKIESLIDEKNKQITTLDSLVKSRFNEMFSDTLNNQHGFKLEYLNNLGVLASGKSKHRPRNDPRLLGGPYPLIQTGDVKRSDLHITQYENTYSAFGLSQSKLWPRGTLCITIAANIAETGILSFDACFPDSVVGFLPNKSVNVVFIRYQIEALKDYLNSRATEVAQKNLNLEKLTFVLFMVPPIKLQNQFEDFVKQVDKLKFVIQKYKRKDPHFCRSIYQLFFLLLRSFAVNVNPHLSAVSVRIGI